MRGHRFLIALLLCLLLAPTCRSVAQSHALPPPVGGITFTDVIRLSQAGLSENTIIAQIKMRQEPFNLSPDDLLQLKSARGAQPRHRGDGGTGASICESPRGHFSSNALPIATQPSN